VVPLERWDVDAFAAASPNPVEPRFGSFVPGAELFDAPAFATSRPEAIYMDPQQRLLLEHAGEVLARHGAPGAAARTAVMVGIGTVDYVGMSSQLPLGLYFATGGANSVAAGRLSYVFGLKGPCLSVDTACSSSLVAAHYSARDLQAGAADAALAAGVNLTLSPKKAAAFTITGMLTPSGRCRTLDAGADGYVRAEDCVVLLLQLAAHAGAGAAAAALLVGSAVNQDGKSSSLTAPNGPAQQAVLRQALERGDLAAGGVAGLEMHGTGTALGDPIEVGAALDVFQGGSAPVTLTAAKSRLGHAETGAGALGVLRAALQLAQGVTHAITHLRQVNPYVASILERSHVAVHLPRQQAPRPGKRLEAVTGVSSFAFQGTNAHLLVSCAASAEPVAEAAPDAAALPWQRRRYWFAAPPHPLLQGFAWAAQPATARLQADLGAALAAPLRDWRVAGCAVALPATLLLELAVAASAVLCDDGFDGALGLRHAVLLGQPESAAAVLTCVADVATGAVRVSTAAAGALASGVACRVLTSSAALPMERRPAGVGPAALLRPSALAAAAPAAVTAALVVTPAATWCLPFSACESAAALQAAADPDAGSMTVSSCGMVTASRLGQSAAAERALAITAVPLQQATCSALLSSGSGAAAGSLHQLTMKAAVAAAMPTDSFVVGWKRLELGSAAPGGATWLLLGAEDCPLASICAPAAGEVHALSVAYCPRAPATSSTEVVAGNEAHLHLLFKAAAAADSLLCVLPESAAAAASHADAYRNSMAWAHTARDLAGLQAKVSVVTCGGDANAAAAAAAHALGKTRFMEDRRSHGTAIDLCAPLPTAQQLHWMLSSSCEGSLALRRGHLYAERLIAPAAAPRLRQPARRLRPDMCCVVTGGTKGLGLQYARQLARHGCKHLVLTSRGAGGALPADAAAELAALGAAVHVRACDAASARQCAELASWLHEHMPAVQVFAHAAGVLAFDLLPDLTPEAFAAVVAPKAVGAGALAAARLPVESVLLFSSTSAAWSQPGAAHYASSNAVLDAAAARWQAAGLPGTAVGFGPFADAGMAAGLTDAMEGVGLRPLNSAGLSAAFAASGVLPRRVHARLGLARFAGVNTVKGPWTFLEDLTQTPATSAPALQLAPPMQPAASAGAGAAARPPAAAGAAPPPLERVEAVVRSAAVEILGDGQLDASGQFPAGGFDSLSAVELSHKIGSALGVDLPGTLVFDYPSVPAIAAFVAAKLAPRPTAGAADTSTVTALVPAAAPSQMQLGAPQAWAPCLLEVSLAARAPQPALDAPGPQGGSDAISVVPFERWDVEATKVSSCAAACVVCAGGMPTW
jgi:3-oxoacyl-(acyl-carrier-protein) synthase/NAD(P)-dependent dehydrogenase (short-subunit alcohol dehydrogenase family)/acyl carrier protein